MSTKKLQIVTPIVTSVNGQTGDVTLDISGGGTGDMKKLTFTGAVTGEYDGTTDVSVDIPSDIYVVQFDTSDTLVNDFDELVSAINSHKIIMLLSSVSGGADVLVANDAYIELSNSNPESVFLSFVDDNLFCYCSIDKDTKKITMSYLYCCCMKYSEGFDPKSGVVYFDEATGLCSTKDNVSPIATSSTAGTIKVGNGLSISDDGTLSVTTATYYTGTSDPVDTLGADGDLYLQTEG